MNIDNTFKYEPIGGGLSIAVTDEHSFGTDSFLLSYFASPKRSDNACDLGTGCGIIPMLWFRKPESAPKQAWAVDIQQKAIAQLKNSIEHSKIENLTPVLADLKEIRSTIPSGIMDVVTCNPPYKSSGSGVLSETSSDQIARHETLCTIDDVCSAAGWLLRFGGRLCICQLPERLVDVLSSMRRSGIEPKRIRFVQQTAASAPWLFLVEGKRGSKPSLKIDPPLILKENGKYTEEMSKIYYKNEDTI